VASLPTSSIGSNAMDISSVSSNGYAAPSQAQVQRPERPEPPPKAENKAAGSEPSRQEDRRPAPVVNMQGQTTGRIVNTSA
jgi:hypothetical protein